MSPLKFAGSALTGLMLTVAASAPSFANPCFTTTTSTAIVTVPQVQTVTEIVQERRVVPVTQTVYQEQIVNVPVTRQVIVNAPRQVVYVH